MTGLVLLLLLNATSLFAADAPPGMAEAAGLPSHTKVGELRGVLMKGSKPQAGKQVVIQVQQDGQTVLTLPKTTDANGEFIFKNIFRDPKFSYTLLSEEGGRIYQHGPLQMGPRQDVLKVRFEIKPENAADMNVEAMPPESPRATPHEKAPGQWQESQMMSILLSAIVLIILAYAFGRYQRKK